jgi:hypothetical protein
MREEKPPAGKVTLGVATSRLIAALASLVVCATAPAQTPDFRIVWVVIGEAATADKAGRVHAARHLFMANDLAGLSLRKVRVQSIDASPTATDVAVGQRFCLSALAITATGADRKAVMAAPLSISVRQDHREHLQLDRTAKDICIRPDAPGEYPIRFNSLLPATDGTTRGAQIFIRVAA